MQALFFGSQVGLDLFDHFGILFVGQIGLARVHGEDAAILEFSLILGNEMEVQMTAGVAIGAVVDLLGRECRVDGLGSAVDVGKVGIALLVRDVDDFADVILISHDAAARMALLLEEDELGDAQVADEDAESIQQFAFHAVAAVAVFHGKNPRSFILLCSLYTNQRSVSRRTEDFECNEEACWNNVLHSSWYEKDGIDYLIKRK